MFGWEERDTGESWRDMILLLCLKTDVSFNKTQIVITTTTVVYCLVFFS